MKNISPHISYKEATKSSTAIRFGIDNVPTSKQLINMKVVAEKCFEPLREHLEISLGISSFYRDEQVNLLIGGSTTSDHCNGRAIDIDAHMYRGTSNDCIFKWLKENVDFDQLIAEYIDPNNPTDPAWVHVSYRSGKENRNQSLIAIKGKGYKLFTDELYEEIYGESCG